MNPADEINSNSSHIHVAFLAFWTTFIVSVMVCAIFWQNFITDHLYNCTDPLSGDFFYSSREWVHNPIVAEHVIGNHSMSDRDTLKQGWSIAKLNALRWGLVLASVAISVISAIYFSNSWSLVWPRQRRAESNSTA